MEKKKKYKSTIRISSDDDLKPFVKSLAVPSISDWKDIIEDYIYVSRKRKNNKLAMLYLQVHIVKDIIVTEGSIKNYRNILNHPEKINEYYPDIKKAEPYLIEFWENELYSSLILLSALKAIGDSLLWRILDYNIPLLYSLSYNEDSGPVDQGKMHELYSLNNELNSDNVNSFVYNAITNSGRIGDFISKDVNDKVEFIELKSSSKIRGKDQKARVSRQKIRMIELENLANTKRGKIGDQLIYLKEIDGIPELKINEIENLIVRSETEGIVSKLLRPYLGVIVENWSINYDEDKCLEHNKNLKDLLVRSNDDRIVIHNSISTVEYSPIRTPYTVYPFNESIIADILMGRIHLEYFLNISMVFEEIEKKGWKIIESVLEKENIDPKKDFICTISKGNLSISIPPSNINRMLFEGMSVESLLKVYSELDPTDQKHSEEALMYNFKGEKTIWR